MVTENQSFGLALAALANNGYSPEVLEILEAAVSEHAYNIAANVSMGGAFEASINLGQTEAVGILINRLAANEDAVAVASIADNPSTGQLIADLIAKGDPNHALDIFIILATNQPTKFAANKTTKKAIAAIKELDLVDVLGKRGAGKALVIKERISEINGRIRSVPKEIS